MSVIVFQKKVWMGVGGSGEFYPSLFWIFGICLTLPSPLLTFGNIFVVFSFSTLCFQAIVAHKPAMKFVTNMKLTTQNSHEQI